MIDENKASLYLVAMVGVVAAVGIFVLLMGAGLSGDVTGQAYIKLKAKDDAAGLVETSTGQQVSGTASASSCSDGKVYCEYCRSKSSACAAGCTQYC